MLAKFANSHNLRNDWYKPDEQGVSARVVGHVFDNVYIASGTNFPLTEGGIARIVTLNDEVSGYPDMHLVLTGPKGNEIVNLAVLCSLAAKIA